MAAVPLAHRDVAHFSPRRRGGRGAGGAPLGHDVFAVHAWLHQHRGRGGGQRRASDVPDLRAEGPGAEPGVHRTLQGSEVFRALPYGGCAGGRQSRARLLHRHDGAPQAHLHEQARCGPACGMDVSLPYFGRCGNGQFRPPCPRFRGHQPDGLCGAPVRHDGRLGRCGVHDRTMGRGLLQSRA